MRKSLATRIAKIAIFTALISVISPLSIPLPGGVSLSLTTFVIFLAGAILPPFEALVSVAVYLLVGLVGVPVFQNFTGGFYAFLGPTGGYLIGYLIGVLVASLILCKKRNFLGYVLAFSICTVIIYAVGYVWFSIVTTGAITLVALIPSVLIFLPFDIIKIICASIVSKKLYLKVK